jgi:hypothetical protein
MEFLGLLIGLGLLAALTSLAIGIGSMAHGGEFDRAHSTQFMFARVASHAVTVILLVIALLVALSRG